MIAFLNLWLFYVGGYVFAYPFRMWAEKKRGEPFEDPELLAHKDVLIPSLIWIFGGLIVSLFVPIYIGILFYIGLFVVVVGLVFVGIAFYSFSQSSGLVTLKIHEFSRNPNYIGWIIFMGGLTLISGLNSLWSYIFLGYFIYTIINLHWTILQEEKFLANKYGDPYREYLKKTPRYFKFKIRK